MKAFKGVATLSLGFALCILGCDNLANLINAELADKTALKSALASANSAKSGVAASVDGSDILETAYWVAAEQLSAFEAAIAAAQEVYDNDKADQAAVDNANAALQAAANEFSESKSRGSKKAEEIADKTALKSALASANSAKSGVAASVDGSDVLETVYWVAAEQLSAFETAIAAAQEVYDNDKADQATVDNANAALQAAANTFTGSKSLGSKKAEQEAAFDVYVAGSYSNAGTSVPCYWKNGVKTDLPLTGEWYRGSADKIVVSGEDVYVVGTVDNGNRSVGCYWKNEALALSLSPNDGGYGYYRDIAVQSEDLYIVGYFETSNGYQISCYWKNGVRTDLAVAENAVNGVAHAIAISGNVIYIAGEYFHEGEGGWMLCFWRDGDRTDLSVNYRPEYIAVSGNDIFITGWTYERRPRQSWYWKNGAFYTLPSGGTQDSMAYAMVISNEDVYISGFSGNGVNRQACYWKNGTLNLLSGGVPGKDSFAYGATLVDNDLYVAGAVDVFYDFGNPDNATSTACYWKNGSKVELADRGSAHSVFVVGKNN